MRGDERLVEFVQPSQPPMKVALVRGVMRLHPRGAPHYFRRFKNSSIALRISHETGTSSRAASLSSFLTCSGLSRIAVSFLRTAIHYTTPLHVSPTRPIEDNPTTWRQMP